MTLKDFLTKLYRIADASGRAQSKAWVSGRSLAGIAGSNHTGSRGCLSVVSVVRFWSARG